MTRKIFPRILFLSHRLILYVTGWDGERNRCFPFWNISSAFPFKVSYKSCPATPCRRQGGEELYFLLIVDLGTRLSGERHAPAALYPWAKDSQYPLDRNNIFIHDGALLVFMIYLTREHPVAEPEIVIRAEIRLYLTCSATEWTRTVNTRSHGFKRRIRLR